MGSQNWWEQTKLWKLSALQIPPKIYCMRYPWKCIKQYFENKKCWGNSENFGKAAALVPDTEVCRTNFLSSSQSIKTSITSALHLVSRIFLMLKIVNSTEGNNKAVTYKIANLSTRSVKLQSTPSNNLLSIAPSQSILETLYKITISLTLLLSWNKYFVPTNNKCHFITFKLSSRVWPTRYLSPTLPFLHIQSKLHSAVSTYRFSYENVLKPAQIFNCFLLPFTDDICRIKYLLLQQPAPQNRQRMRTSCVWNRSLTLCTVILKSNIGHPYMRQTWDFKSTARNIFVHATWTSFKISKSTVHEHNGPHYFYVVSLVSIHIY